MEDEPGGGMENEGWISEGKMEGEETLEGELGQELAVLHRVFRHDFRNRLNVVIGQAQLAKDKTNDEALEEYLDIILAEGKSLVETVDQVALIQRIASSTAAPKVVNIAPTLENIITEFDQQTTATFEFDIPESAWVWANPKYETALRELIENAVVHNDSSDPQVTVRVTQATMTDVVIADNGPGIPSHMKASLETQQVNPTNHLTSLGLWTAYWILTRSGGTLSIEDNEPRGCRITTSLRSAPPPET